jgi:hypothetical protein
VHAFVARKGPLIAPLIGDLHAAELNGHLAAMNKALAAGAGKEAQRMAAKQQMATAAHQILQDPNKHQHQLQLLLKLLDSDYAQANADTLRWCFQTLLLRV